MLLADAAIGGHSGSSRLRQRRSWLASHIAAIQALDQATLQRAHATVARSRQVLCQADRSLAYLKSAASVLLSMIDVGDRVGLGSATPLSEPVVSVGSPHGEPAQAAARHLGGDGGQGGSLAVVNRAAICSGSHPDDVQRRRRSIAAGERGRDPTRRLGSAGIGGTALRAAISSASLCASSSDTAPQAKPFHTAADRSASRSRGVPGRARLMSSANMNPAPSWGRRRRVRPRSRNRAVSR